MLNSQLDGCFECRKQESTMSEEHRTYKMTIKVRQLTTRPTWYLTGCVSGSHCHHLAHRKILLKYHTLACKHIERFNITTFLVAVLK